MQSIQALKSLPQEIRSWIASEATADKVRKINIEFGLQEEETRLIPHLLFRLVVKDLEANQFVDTLADWLDISPSSANIIAGEIKENILTPIAGPLSDWGLDLNLIEPIEVELGRPIVAPPPPPLQPQIAYKPPTIISPFPQVAPQAEYEPPPPPAMGGRANIGATGAAPIEDIVKKGGIHIIGDAHEHSEKENLESGILNMEGGIEPLRAPIQTKKEEEKKIRLPIPGASKEDKIEDEQDSPFILHKEAAFTPVLKEQEWKPPSQVYPPKFPKEILGDASPAIRIPSPPIPPSVPLSPTQKPRIVHYDENESTLAISGRPPIVDLKAIREKTRAVPPPPHNLDQELIYSPNFPKESLAGEPPVQPKSPKTSPSQVSRSETWESKPQPPLPVKTSTKEGLPSIATRAKEGPNLKGNTVDLR